MIHFPLTSTTRAPSGMTTSPRGPTALIRSPETSTTASPRGVFPVPSITVAPTKAVTPVWGSSAASAVICASNRTACTRVRKAVPNRGASQGSIGSSVRPRARYRALAQLIVHDEPSSPVLSCAQQQALPVRRPSRGRRGRPYGTSSARCRDRLRGYARSRAAMRPVRSFRPVRSRGPLATPPRSRDLPLGLGTQHLRPMRLCRNGS